jgi:ribonuclease J
VILVAVIDGKTGEPAALPDIVSRGFVFMKEHQELITASRAKANQILLDSKSRVPGGEIDISNLKDKLRDEMGEFLYIKTELRPMVIPVIIEV